MSDKSTLYLRIGVTTERALRKKTNKRGDLSSIVTEAIESCDWASLDVAPRPRGGAVKRAVEYRVILPTVTRGLHDKVTSEASRLGVSASALVDSALRMTLRRKKVVRDRKDA